MQLAGYIITYLPIPNTIPFTLIFFYPYTF